MIDHRERGGGGEGFFTRVSSREVDPLHPTYYTPPSLSTMVAVGRGISSSCQHLTSPATLPRIPSALSVLVSWYDVD